jgi:hypothetical protein
VDFNIRDQLLIRYSAFIRYWRKWKYNGAVHQLFIDFEKAYNSVRREISYNIVIKFATSMKLVRLITMCLNETYSKVYIDKNLLDTIPYSEWSETRRFFITITFQLHFRICPP